MIEVFFWVLMLLWIVYGGLAVKNIVPLWSGSILAFFLFLLLGLKVFHNPLSG